MTIYSVYNLVLATAVLPVAFVLVGPSARFRHLRLSARIGILLVSVSYPWDFFAIHLGVWKYPSDPGLRIYGVPLNDLIFMWLCTYLACSVLIAIDSRNGGSEGYSERKDAGEQHAGDNRTRSSRI